ncbi:hypothetical protein [Azospirillum picis]|uniref:Uncharacterized protein n=1 Tax=Azospirillum picis TaxID=488438 RepID=A0ABU0MLK1_9PROT|nr:hypothetical protein [Azospirillum picis]MBP2300433.1 hypothetical protein [Azospirillum picis]MDQ0534229.1 hypothetical protein [Azospirillum picis]
MPPIERARHLSRLLQARFRIDLFSALVERDFEKRLADTILEAERDAYRRGREAALADLRAGVGGASAIGEAGGLRGETARTLNRRFEDDPRPGATAGQSTAM